MAEAQSDIQQNPQGPDVVSKLAEYEKKFLEKDREIENYKKRVAQLEEELVAAQKLIVQHLKENEEVDCLKSESEKTLTKAKSIIFERTKVIKNQELQIEAYNQQIDSLKDVVRITKDLLEIRNLEVKQLEEKINCMEEKVKAEKERQDLLHKKLETMIRHNGELKREYETQLCLFSALRERYSERELARGVVDDIRGTRPNQTGPIANGLNNTVSEPLPATNTEEPSPEQSKTATNQENQPDQVGNTTEEPSISSPASPEQAKTVNNQENQRDQVGNSTEQSTTSSPASPEQAKTVNNQENQPDQVGNSTEQSSTSSPASPEQAKTVNNQENQPDQVGNSTEQPSTRSEITDEPPKTE